MKTQKCNLLFFILLFLFLESSYSQEMVSAPGVISFTSGLTHDAPVGNNADPYAPSYESHAKEDMSTFEIIK